MLRTTGINMRSGYGPHGPATLAIGPANFAGQAYQWATALNEYSRVRAVAFSHRPLPCLYTGVKSFSFPTHQSLPHHRMSTSIGKYLRIRHILRDITHVAVDGFLPLYGRHDRSHVGNELASLRRQGLAVALIAHGTDVRNPDTHISRYDYSYYSDAPADWVSKCRQISSRNRSTAVEAGAEVYVSTPDLLLDLPFAQWLPVCIDTSAWYSVQPALERKVPRVLHIPSRRSPSIKGTGYIDPVLNRLAALGRIHYLSPDRVPHSSMRALVEHSDIVVDQIQSGSYGVAAVEAMAAGRLVVGNVGEDVAQLMDERPPIVNARPSELSDVFEAILDDCDHYARIAEFGPGFVRRWHDGRISAKLLTSFVQPTDCT